MGKRFHPHPNLPPKGEGTIGATDSLARLETFPFDGWGKGLMQFSSPFPSKGRGLMRFSDVTSGGCERHIAVIYLPSDAHAARLVATFILGGITLGLCNPTRRGRPRSAVEALPDDDAALRHPARTAKQTLLPLQGRADAPRQAAQSATHAPTPQPLTPTPRLSLCPYLMPLCEPSQGGFYYRAVILLAPGRMP